MPSASKKQHRLMEAAAHTRGGYGGVPQKVGQDFVAADKAAGKFKAKGKPKMAKKHALSGHGHHGNDHGSMKGGESAMMGGKGMSPRKATAMGNGPDGSGNAGVESFAEAQSHAGQHPDARAMTGAMGAMEDGDRGIGAPVHHTKGHHPAQAAPSHGPHHVEGYQDHHGRGSHMKA
jgi:hypothetical protein